MLFRGMLFAQTESLLFWTKCLPRGVYLPMPHRIRHLIPSHPIPSHPGYNLINQLKERMECFFQKN